MGLKISKKEALKAITNGKASLSLDEGTDTFWLRHVETGKLLFAGTISDFFSAIGVKHMVDWRI